MEKDFDEWNNQKKKIQASTEKKLFPKEAEVWMSVLGKNIGFEQNGSGDMFSRPVLVIKKFNNHMFWVVPLSTKQKSFDFYYNYIDPNGNAVSVILAQMKLISIKRFERKLYDIGGEKFLSIRKKLGTFLL